MKQIAKISGSILIVVSIPVMLYLFLCEERLYLFGQRLINIPGNHILVGNSKIKIMDNWLLDSIIIPSERKILTLGIIPLAISDDKIKFLGSTIEASDIEEVKIYRFKVLEGCAVVKTFQLHNMTTEAIAIYDDFVKKNPPEGI